MYHALPISDWHTVADDQARDALERDGLVLLPQLRFALSQEEQMFLDPAVVDPKTKSVKYAPATDRLWGMAEPYKESPVLKQILRRYAQCSTQLVKQLFPEYAPRLVVGNTSFRPVEAQGRVQSKRHDDRLLHVDAFPSRPNGGQRILRVFSNIHPGDKPRVWRTGEPFADVASRFLPRLRAPLPLSAALLRHLKLTKGLRTPYDHYMLRLHDAMKFDDAYQQQAAQCTLQFAPGSSWIVFTDQVSHAAMSGQHAMEQTFGLPVDAMRAPQQAPLRVLEQLKQRKLG